jgi:hypothetical protein
MKDIPSSVIAKPVNGHLSDSHLGNCAVIVLLSQSRSTEFDPSPAQRAVTLSRNDAESNSIASHADPTRTPSSKPKPWGRFQIGLVIPRGLVTRDLERSNPEFRSPRQTCAVWNGPLDFALETEGFGRENDQTQILGRNGENAKRREDILLALSVNPCGGQIRSETLSSPCRILLVTMRAESRSATLLPAMV